MQHSRGRCPPVNERLSALDLLWCGCYRKTTKRIRFVLVVVFFLPDTKWYSYSAFRSPFELLTRHNAFFSGQYILHQCYFLPYTFSYFAYLSDFTFHLLRPAQGIKTWNFLVVCGPTVDKQSIILLRYHVKAVSTCTEKALIHAASFGLNICLLVSAMSNFCCEYKLLEIYSNTTSIVLF